MRRCVFLQPNNQTNNQWKVKKNASKAPCLGLFSYPVLMTADILLYRYVYERVAPRHLLNRASLLLLLLHCSVCMKSLRFLCP